MNTRSMAPYYGRLPKVFMEYISRQSKLPGTARLDYMPYRTGTYSLVKSPGPQNGWLNLYNRYAVSTVQESSRMILSELPHGLPLQVMIYQDCELQKRRRLNALPLKS